MVGYILKKSLAVLSKKPIMLWGVSILNTIILSLISIFCGMLPIISIPLTLTLDAGMAALFLDGYNGKEVNSEQLFRGFTKDCIGRVPAGMCWKYLWNIIWFLVPFVGLITGVVKYYSYCFTPYILLTRPDITPMEALKVSMKETEGYRVKIFLTDLLIAVATVLLLLILSAFIAIPFIGALICIIGYLAVIVLLPLFCGLVRAAFYQEITSGNIRTAYNQYQPNNYQPQGGYQPQQGYQQPQGGYQQPQQNYQQPQQTAPQQPSKWVCAQCGTENAAVSKFCKHCGLAHN